MINKEIYQKNDDSVWIRNNFSGIKYSDGDSYETTLKETLKSAKDLSVFSEELRLECKDWVTTYHLSPLRSNLMRPLAELFFEGQSVLEIGAGCGAITRYLGESKTNVFAIEGSHRRASIARLRTKDLENVEVICETFEDFTSDHRFDVVTFIGVLEYSNLFISGEDATLAAIQKAASFLKEGGKLVIAIENQLGLKYFAGYLEDHISIPMYGIEDHYTKRQPQTFGKHILKQKLENADLKNIQFLFPFPDYKLPISILTETGINSNEFDASVFASHSVTKDLQTPRKLSFNLERAWGSIFKNKIAADLSNSFLIVASKKTFSLFSNEVLAIHYSTNRKIDFCKETFFIKGKSEIQVKPALIKNKSNLSNGIIEYIKPKQSKYINGTPLLAHFIAMVSKPDWHIEDIEYFFAEYYKHLSTLLAAEGVFVEKEKDFVLPGTYLDAIPSNIVINADGQTFYIDREWNLLGGLTLGYLVFRAIISCLEHISVYGTSDRSPKTRKEFVFGVMNYFEFDIQEHDYQLFLKQESELHSFSSGIKNENFASWSPEGPLLSKSSDQISASEVIEQQQIISNLEKLSIDRLNDIQNIHSKLEKANETSIHRLHEIEHLDLELKERDRAIEKISAISLERLEEIKKLDNQLKERDKAIEKISNESILRLKEIENLDARLRETDKTLEQITLLSTTRLELLENVENRLQAQEILIKELQLNLSERDSNLKAMTEISISRLSKIESLHAELKERDIKQISTEKLIDQLYQANKLAESNFESAAALSIERLNEIHKLDQQLRETSQALQKATELSMERLSGMEVLDNELKNRDKALQKLTMESLNRLHQIEALDKRLAETDKALNEVTQLSVDRLSELQRLKTTFTEQDQAAINNIRS